MPPPGRPRPTLPRRRCLAALALLALPSCRRAPAAPSGISLAAASDLSLALPELASLFAARAGNSPSLTLGSSGLLARQIAEGAPFDVFASASRSYVDQLVSSGHALGDTALRYARGKLVLLTRPGMTLPPSLRDLADPRFVKIAIANPTHAPYGKAAREALDSAGVLRRVEGRLVFGENVQQALMFVRTGNADAAIVARSLVNKDAAFAPVDEAHYQPIDQVIVVTRRARDEALARSFVRFVASAEAQAILARHGFGPGDAPI